MKRLSENRRHIMLRYAFIILCILAFSVRIVNHLIDNTIIHADKWNERAMEELLQVDSIIPERGNILANDGSILATNLRYYNLHIDYQASRFKADTLEKYSGVIADSLARRFPSRNARQWKSFLTDPLKLDPKKRPRYLAIAKGVSHADVQYVKSLPFFNMNSKLRTGLISENYIVRANPYGNMASRSIGRVTRSEKLAGVHGYSGLEMALDSYLYGKIGYFKRVPLTKGIVNWTDIPAIPGADIQTTIDINIQDIVENELNDMLEYSDADWGVAAMMEVETGDIVAISNLEKDPNSIHYIEGMNRAVKRYEPGSVVKVLSMMIALEDGIVSDPDEVITTGSAYAYAGGPAIMDAHPVEQLTVNDVIEMSSNIGMTRIIARKYNDNPSAFYSRVKSTGFLEPMGTNIAGERTPRFDSIPNNRGGRIAMSRMCYGYATEIPPLYTLALYNAIAAGGNFIRPRLVSKITSNGVDSLIPMSYMSDKQQICSPVTAAKLRKMLRNVVFGPHGTATRLRNKNVAIAGKTGTCYMIEDNTRAYNKDRKRLTFCGFFPADKPKYTCIVLIANPRQNVTGAASTSGEVVKNIALKLYSRGMLDNESDYTDIKNPGTSPTFYATRNTGYHENLRDHLTIGSSRVIKTPVAPAKGVPDVTGMGAREAIAILENAGYNVAFKGTGYVGSQSPAAGQTLRRGGTVNLALYN